jgi:hypothetical protein
MPYGANIYRKNDDRLASNLRGAIMLKIDNQRVYDLRSARYAASAAPPMLNTSYGAPARDRFIGQDVQYISNTRKSYLYDMVGKYKVYTNGVPSFIYRGRVADVEKAYESLAAAQEEIDSINYDGMTTQEKYNAVYLIYQDYFGEDFYYNASGIDQTTEESDFMFDMCNSFYVNMDSYVSRDIFSSNGKLFTEVEINRLGMDGLTKEERFNTILDQYKMRGNDIENIMEMLFKMVCTDSIDKDVYNELTSACLMAYMQSQGDEKEKSLNEIALNGFLSRYLNGQKDSTGIMLKIMEQRLKYYTDLEASGDKAPSDWNTEEGRKLTERAKEIWNRIMNGFGIK